MSSGVKNRLVKLSNQGFKPKKILDIGANVGEFTIMCETIWPEVESNMVEANKNCEAKLSKLDQPFFIEVLGENDGDELTFYLTKDNDLCTGNSVYLEKTEHYSEDRVIKEKRETKKVDTLFKGETFDLIKLDTQGSELDILRGSTEVIEDTKYVLIETSLKEYNIGAPLEKDIVGYMKSIGFGKYDILDVHKWPVNHGLFQKGEVFQRDVLFYK